MSALSEEMRRLAQDERDSLGMVRVWAKDDLLRWAEAVESLENQLLEALEGRP